MVVCAHASGWRCSCWNTNWHWQWKMFENVNVNDVPGRLRASSQQNQKVVWGPVPQSLDSRFYSQDLKLCDCLSNHCRCKCQPDVNAIWAKWVIAKPWIIAKKKLFASCRWTFLLKWSSNPRWTRGSTLWTSQIHSWRWSGYALEKAGMIWWIIFQYTGTIVTSEWNSFGLMKLM